MGTIWDLCNGSGIYKLTQTFCDTLLEKYFIIQRDPHRERRSIGIDTTSNYIKLPLRDLQNQR